MPIMDAGLDEAERISEANKKSSGLHRLPQLVIKDGEQAAIHFITDVGQVIAFDVHSFIPTKDKPEEFKGDKWPKSMWAVCQNARAFRLRDDSGNLLDGYEDGYGECYIHAHYAGQKDNFDQDISRPANQVYGLGVRREPVTDPVTKRITGFRDKMIEYKDKDGHVWQIPDIVLISQKYSNFWHPVKATAYVSGTILGADYIISRKGNDYTPAPAVQTPDLLPGTDGYARYEKALELIGFDLKEFLLAHSTADHYKRWFIEGATPEGGYGRKSDGADDGESTDAAAASGEESAAGPQVDAAALEGFRASLSGRGDKK